MRSDDRDHATGDGVRNEPAEPAEPAKVHGDVLDDLIPRDLREPAPGIGADDAARETRRERSPEKG